MEKKTLELAKKIFDSHVTADDSIKKEFYNLYNQYSYLLMHAKEYLENFKSLTNLPKYEDSIIPCIILIVHMISPIKFPYALAETPYIYLYGTFTETRKGVLFHLTSIFDERKNNLFYCNIHFNGTKEIGEDDYKRLIEN